MGAASKPRGTRGERRMPYPNHPRGPLPNKIHPPPGEKAPYPVPYGLNQTESSGKSQIQGSAVDRSTFVTKKRILGIPVENRPAARAVVGVRFASNAFSSGGRLLIRRRQ